MQDQRTVRKAHHFFTKTPSESKRKDKEARLLQQGLHAKLSAYVLGLLRKSIERTSAPGPLRCLATAGHLGYAVGT